MPSPPKLRLFSPSSILFTPPSHSLDSPLDPFTVRSWCRIPSTAADSHNEVNAGAALRRRRQEAGNVSPPSIAPQQHDITPNTTHPTIQPQVIHTNILLNSYTGPQGASGTTPPSKPTPKPALLPF